MPIVDHIRL